MQGNLTYGSNCAGGYSTDDTQATVNFTANYAEIIPSSVFNGDTDPLACSCSFWPISRPTFLLT